MSRGGIGSPCKAGRPVCEEGNASFCDMSLTGRIMLESLVKILTGIRIVCDRNTCWKSQSSGAR